MIKKQRVLVSNSVYNLFLYLLYSTEEEIIKTFYFIGKGVPRSISDNLGRYYYFDEDTKIKKSKYWKIFIKFFRKFKWPFLRNASLYGLDFYWFIIGNQPYTFIEDAPNIFSIYTSGSKLYKIQDSFWKKKNKIAQFIYKLIFGGVYQRSIANNDQCERVIQTKNDFVDYLQGKEIVVIDIVKCWKESSEIKKSLILKIFDITQNDIEELKAKKIILFTQPFVADNFLTEQEHIEVYSKIINNYTKDDIIIKPHPRDLVNYSYFFPNITIFKKVAPMQLLDLLNVKFEVAVTISSTSVVSIPYEIKIDWYGSKIHPKILKEYGNIELEDIRV